MLATENSEAPFTAIVKSFGCPSGAIDAAFAMNELL